MSDRPRSVGAEEGVVLTLVAILLPVLFAAAGLALDLGNLHLNASRQQRAADAAALAGTVYLPKQPDKAFAAARQLAQANGYVDGVDDTSVVIERTAKPTQLKVTIRRSVENLFFGALGHKTSDVERDAVGDYQSPVAMGSPANTYGNEPVGSGETRWSNTYHSDKDQPEFWGNVAGPHSAKSNGDGLHATICAVGVAGCSGVPLQNTDYDANGYFYTIRVPAGSTGNLAIEVFDPAFVNVGDSCEASTLSGATSATNPYVTDPAARYVAGDSPFCTGDNLFTGAAGDGVPPTTTYVFRAPSTTSADPHSGVVLSGTCAPTQLPGWNVPLAPALGSGGDVALQKVFRRWVRLCEVPSPGPGDYVLQVRTNVPMGGNVVGPGDVSTPGGGHNRFSIRAALLNPAGKPAGGKPLAVFATDTMGIYTNSHGSTEFYLAQIPSGSDGQTLVISLFDIGDVSGIGTLKILEPDKSPPFTDCQAAGPITGPLDHCTLNGVSSATFNGQREIIRVRIPTGYACDDSDPSACWVKIRYNGFTAAVDTTTWSATLDGSPVRLVE